MTAAQREGSGGSDGAADIVQVKRLATPADLRARAGDLRIELPVDDSVEVDGPLTRALTIVDGSAGELAVGNRWTILPMEGWDATADGLPTDLVHRRWRRFGESGAKLIWGGEAVAVEPSGRANPHQLAIVDGSEAALADLRTTLVDAHAAAHGTTEDLLVGLQLTHSGRWSRPDGTPAPRTAFRHPVLDERVGATDAAVLSDDELDHLARRYVEAAMVAADAGFAFVDIKHCHGYLLHELLAAAARPGRYGGALDDRLRFLTTVVEAIRAARPGLAVGVRLSVYDTWAYGPGPGGRGRPIDVPGRPRPFGADDGRSTRPDRGPRRARPVRRAGHRHGLRHRRQPLLQPSHPTPRVLPAVGRVHTAARPADRCRTAAHGHRRAGPRASGDRGRRQRLLLPPGPRWPTSPRRWSGRGTPPRSVSGAWSCRTRRCRRT